MMPDQEQQGHGHCGALKRDGSGKRCRNPAGWGTDHDTGPCKLHGGATTAHKTRARRLAAVEACRTFGVSVTASPEQALLDELYAAIGDVAFYRERCRELGREAMVVGITRHRYEHAADEPRPADLNETVIDAKPNVWLVLLNGAQRHLVEVAATIVKLGIERRAVDLMIAEAQVMHDVLERSIGVLSAADQERVRAELPRQLRLLAGGDEA
jgi:hypothetical protein